MRSSPRNIDDLFIRRVDINEEILTEEEIQRAVQKIFKLAQTDAEFRTLCLSDPAEAVREVTGKALPPGFNTQFVDPDADGVEKKSC